MMTAIIVIFLTYFYNVIDIPYRLHHKHVSQTYVLIISELLALNKI